MDIILGTAGHIDHGKTTLVQALTGINCDRLDEEKRRGITIELGFAWMVLPDGRRLGIVDVPGHEKFVKNMVAGASGVDCVLLVIAADEGVMPQTREHMEICSLLGVRSGLIALTKTDLVDSEWLDFVREDIRTAMTGSFMENAPIIPVSSSTGEGMDNLRSELLKLINKLPVRKKSDIFRLPVDRIFSMKGFGTVVTGTLVSGECQQGEKLCIMPSGKLARARNLQVHNHTVEKAHEGQRCAINLQGLEVADINRGDIVARPDTLFPANRWVMRLNCLKSSPLPIRQRMEVHFHHGSGECQARIILLDRDRLEPGQSALAEARFLQPMAAVYGDHCVLRAHSPLRAIGGGIIISPLPPLLKKRGKDYGHNIAILEKLGETEKDVPDKLALKSPAELARLAIALSPAPGTDLRHLRVNTGLGSEDLESALAELEERGEAYCWDEGCWIGKDALRICMDQCKLRAEELHKKEPLKSFFAHNAMLAGWGENLPSKFTQAVLELAINQNILEEEGSGLKLARHKIRLNEADKKIMDILLDKIRAGQSSPPFIREFIEEYGWDTKRLSPLLNYLCDSGKLLKIQEGVYYYKEEFVRITEKIRIWFSEHEELDVGGMKAVLGISRKYAIPILEYLDTIRMTYRVDNQRRLRKNDENAQS